MDNIKSIINQVVKNLSTNKPDSGLKIDRIWENILEPTELLHTKIVGVNDGTVLINVDSPTWLYQMKMKRSSLLQRLKDEVPDIKLIRFRIGKVNG